MLFIPYFACLRHETTSQEEEEEEDNLFFMEAPQMAALLHALHVDHTHI